MKNSLIVLIAAIIFSLSVVFSAIYIGSAINEVNSVSSVNTDINESLLMNTDQAAKYLGISADSLVSKIKREKIEKYELGTYDTYRFIPYLEIDGVIYFTKSELQKWAEYNTKNH